jgi:hypothetical protein
MLTNPKILTLNMSFVSSFKSVELQAPFFENLALNLLSKVHEEPEMALKRSDFLCT